MSSPLKCFFVKLAYLMSTLAKRLAEALEKRQRSPAELARGVSKTESAVSQWLSGETKSMRGESLLGVSGYLNISANWLATGKGQMEIAVASIQSSQGQSARMVATVGPSLGETLKYLSGYLSVLDSRSRGRVGQLLKEFAEEPDTHERSTTIF